MTSDVCLCVCAQCTRDILRVGDVWATDLSPLELQNADTKRTAESGASRHIEFSQADGNKTLTGLRGGKEGPMQLKERKQYSTTMALSVMRKLLTAQKLRRGDGPIAYPESRRAERLFGEHGRTKRRSSHVKLEKLGVEYNPREDTCLKAFVRMMAQAAAMRDMDNASEASNGSVSTS